MPGTARRRSGSWTSGITIVHATIGPGTIRTVSCSSCTLFVFGGQEKVKSERGDQKALKRLSTAMKICMVLSDGQRRDAEIEQR